MLLKKFANDVHWLFMTDIKLIKNKSMQYPLLYYYVY